MANLERNNLETKSVWTEDYFKQSDKIKALEPRGKGESRDKNLN